MESDFKFVPSHQLLSGMTRVMELSTISKSAQFSLREAASPTLIICSAKLLKAMYSWKKSKIIQHWYRYFLSVQRGTSLNLSKFDILLETFNGSHLVMFCQKDSNIAFSLVKLHHVATFSRVLNGSPCVSAILHRP